MGNNAERNVLRVAELGARRRRRELARLVARILLMSAAILALYFKSPADRGGFGWPGGPWLAGSLLFLAFLVLELRTILRAELPELRAIEATVVLLVVFLTAAASGYLVLSARDPSTFTQPLDHMSALYFTTTVFSTVGFGDISPASTTARGVVTAQMVIDVLFIGVLGRLIVAGARMGLAHGSSAVNADEDQSPRPV